MAARTSSGRWGTFRRLLLFLAALGAGAYLFWLHAVVAPVRALDAPPVQLDVPIGSSVEAIGRQLQALGYVRHPLIFRLLVFSLGANSGLKAGTYPLEGPLSLRQIVELLQRGEALRRDVTFPEGKNLMEMADIVAEHGLSKAEFLAAARDPKPILDLDPLATDLEGYLFPDTYDVPNQRPSASALVQRMLQRFRNVITPELPRVAARGLTLRQTVTLAAIVELETARPDERPRVAAVFSNRLKRGMLLQTDPTVIYALKLAGRWNGNIRKADLQMASPYNTYRVAGLPPGPIASPGRASLLAALDPAPVGDLYFVSRNDGTHEFSATLSDHARAVDRYQRHPHKAGG
jgi:UPF0755 protein